MKVLITILTKSHDSPSNPKGPKDPIIGYLGFG